MINDLIDEGTYKKLPLPVVNICAEYLGDVWDYLFAERFWREFNEGLGMKDRLAEASNIIRNLGYYRFTGGREKLIKLLNCISVILRGRKEHANICYRKYSDKKVDRCVCGLLIVGDDGIEHKGDKPVLRCIDCVEPFINHYVNNHGGSITKKYGSHFKGYRPILKNQGLKVGSVIDKCNTCHYYPFIRRLDISELWDLRWRVVKAYYNGTGVI
jgi:hypothetical protein